MNNYLRNNYHIYIFKMRLLTILRFLTSHFYFICVLKFRGYFREKEKISQLFCQKIRKFYNCTNVSRFWRPFVSRRFQSRCTTPSRPLPNYILYSVRRLFCREKNPNDTLYRNDKISTRAIVVKPCVGCIYRKRR